MKFNLLTKYILIYVSVAIIGFVGVTVISYKIDYNRVYSEQTENMYRQAVSIAAANAGGEKYIFIKISADRKSTRLNSSHD